MRGGMGPLAGRAGASPWSDLPVSGRAEVPPRSVLPLNRVLYMSFSIFVYSSNNVIASLVRINSTLVGGTLKYSRFSLSSSSFRDRAPAMKLRWCTTQPDRCMTLPSADRRKHSRFRICGHFPCKSIWSFVPKSILSDLFVGNPLFLTYRFRTG